MGVSLLMCNGEKKKTVVLGVQHKRQEWMGGGVLQGVVVCNSGA